MSQKISLKEAEQKAFRARYNDGLLDIFLGCFFLIFVIAPFLSSYLGDFWSSAVLIPFWSLVFLVLWLIRKYKVTPRIGVVKFSLARKAKLVKFTFIMLIINVIAFILGVFAVFSFGKALGQTHSIIMGIIFLIGFSIAAYFLNFNRFYIYGLLTGFSPLVGEWLWLQGYATHHGFPITFGITSAIMLLVGLSLLFRLLHSKSVPEEDFSYGES